MSGIIYHLLSQKKPVKETLTGTATSETFKFFKMIYNVLKSHHYLSNQIEEALDKIEEGDFDFETDPPYVAEIIELGDILSFNVLQIKNIFRDHIIEPSLRLLISHPYLYQDKTIQEFGFR